MTHQIYHSETMEDFKDIYKLDKFTLPIIDDNRL
jgi:hypothetical protein